MADRGDEFSFFQVLQVKVYIRINKSSSYKTYDHQIWQAGTRGVDSS